MRHLSNKLQITDYSYRSTVDSIFPFTFVPNDGYIALPSVLNVYSKSRNPLFGSIMDQSVGARIHLKLGIHSGSRTVRYRKTRSWSGPIINIYAGYYSIIATPNNFAYMPSALFVPERDRIFRMKGQIDVFCLAVVKITDLPKVTLIPSPKYSRYMKQGITFNTEVNKASMKIIVSTERVRKTLFTKEYYTPTFRREILREIENAKRTEGLTVEDVPSEYIDGFFRQPYAYKTNSVMEAIKMDTDIKNRVFSNLNKQVV